MATLKLTISSLCLFVNFLCLANDSTLVLKLEKKLQGKYTTFDVDNTGNIYAINNKNQLIKFNQYLDSIATFNNAYKYGKITSIDASNMFKILVFYKPFSTIIVLDKFLSEVNKIDLRSQNIFEIACVANSYDNQIWLFDEQENKLKKIDDNGIAHQFSNDFRLLFDTSIIPNKITDNNGTLFVSTHNCGTYLFDYYGGFKKKIATTFLKNIQIINNKIVGVDGNKIISFTKSTFDESIINTNLLLGLGFVFIIKNNNFYFLNSSNELCIYKMQ
jgi:hypothetical protein